MSSISVIKKNGSKEAFDIDLSIDFVIAEQLMKGK